MNNVYYISHKSYGLFLRSGQHSFSAEEIALWALFVQYVLVYLRQTFSYFHRYIYWIHTKYITIPGTFHRYQRKQILSIMRDIKHDSLNSRVSHVSFSFLRSLYYVIIYFFTRELKMLISNSGMKKNPFRRRRENM